MDQSLSAGFRKSASSRTLLRRAFPAIALSFLAIALSATGIRAASHAARIVWDIDPDQFSGVQFRGHAKLLFLDAADQLVDTLFPATLGLTLASDAGNLTHTPLDSPAFVVGGILDLEFYLAKVDDATGSVTLSASAPGFAPATAQINLLGATATVSSVYTDDANPFVIPNGTYTVIVNVKSISSPAFPVARGTTVDLFFRGGGGSKKLILGDIGANGTATRKVSVRTDGLSIGTDTLVVRVSSSYTGLTDTIAFITQTKKALTILSAPPGEAYGLPTGLQNAFYPGGTPLNFQFPVDSSSLLFVGLPVTGEIVGQIGTGQPDSIGSFEFSYINGGGPIRQLTMFLRTELSTGPNASLSSLRLVGSYDRNGLRLEREETLPFSLRLLDLPVIQGGSVSFVPETLVINSPQIGLLSFQLTSPVPLVLRSFNSKLLIRNVLNQVNSSEVTATDTFPSGSFQLDVPDILLSDNFLGNNLSAGAFLQFGSPASLNDFGLGTFLPRPLVAVRAPAIQIVSLIATAPNTPKVNTGQSFQLRCGVANLSDAPISNVSLRLASDGQSVYDSSLVVATLPAHDTTFVVLDVIAANQSSSGEVFRVDIMNPADAALPPIDNTALIIISKPPRIVITPFLSGAAGGIITTGSEFSLVVDIRNDGEGAISGTQYELSSSVDLGVSNPIRGSLTVGQPLSVTYTAPSLATSFTLTFQFLSPPLDVNTGLPADIANGSFTLPLDVAVTRNPSLFAAGAEADGNLVTAGMTQPVLQFTFRNDGPSSLGAIGIDTVVLRFFDVDGNGLNVGNLIEPGSVTVTDGALQIGTGTFSTGKLILALDSAIIAPGDSLRCTAAVQWQQNLPGRFVIVGSTNELIARLTEGAFTGQPVEVSTPAGDTIVHELFVQGGESFQSSLRVKDNPINPNQSPGEFRFLLPENGTVSFRVHSLLGELVYEQEIAVDPSSAGHIQVITWDGRTQAGDLARNGVYLVSITDGQGNQARMKVAVLK